MTEFKHEVILCIINSGFSDAVMDAAREFGAGGGTVINARGTAAPEAEKLFNITIQLLGFKAVIQKKIRKSIALKRILSYDDEYIINFDV